MSRAPTKEPVSTVKNYITPTGLQRLRDEHRFLLTRERPAVTQVVAWAASNGDRSENADYQYGKRRLRQIDRRIRFLTKRIDAAEVVDPEASRSGRASSQVFFGATVRYANAAGTERVVSIVGADEVDLDRNYISWLSPLARALMKAGPGDRVSLHAPGGTEQLEILDVRYQRILMEPFSEPPGAEAAPKANSKIVRGTLLVLVMLISLNGVAVAQSSNIAGVVSDGQDRAIPGVSVTTIPQSGGPFRQTTTASDGSYRFDGLPDGTYRVDFDLRHFEVVRRNHVRVRRDTGAKVDATLRLRGVCECLTPEPPSPWAQRAGQVVDKAGHPLPHARVELVGRQGMYTDREGRFLIRVPVNEPWPLKATDSGFQEVTQQVSGADAASVVLGLEYIGTTGVPDDERFGGCECDGYLRLPATDDKTR